MLKQMMFSFCQQLKPTRNGAYTFGRTSLSFDAMVAANLFQWVKANDSMKASFCNNPLAENLDAKAEDFKLN